MYVYAVVRRELGDREISSYIYMTLEEELDAHTL